MIALFKEKSDANLRLVTVIDAGYDEENEEFWLRDTDGDIWTTEMSRFEAENNIQDLFDSGKITLTNFYFDFE